MGAADDGEALMDEESPRGASLTRAESESVVAAAEARAIMALRGWTCGWRVTAAGDGWPTGSGVATASASAAAGFATWRGRLAAGGAIAATAPRFVC
jgi:hypothetical protein